MKLLVDTCALIWAISEPDRLSPTARSALSAGDSRIFFSPICCAELAWGVERGRIEIDGHWKPWLRHHLEINQWEEIPLDRAILEEAYSLPGSFHADPVDRILIATSRLLRLGLVTADRKILDYPHVDSVW